MTRFFSKLARSSQGPRWNGCGFLRAAAELANLGQNLLQQKKWTGAESVLRDSLAIFEKKQPDTWWTYRTRAQLGGALLGQKRYSTAEPLLLEGYKGMKRHKGMTQPQFRKVRLTEAVERLVTLYEAIGNKEVAAKWRKELKGQRK